VPELVPNLDALIDALDRKSPARVLMEAFRQPTVEDAERVLRALVEGEHNEEAEIRGSSLAGDAGP
jgi:hypothetical protein